MDIVTHALYGATLCSRTGLAGGLKKKDDRPHRSWTTDWTVWCAVFFGLLPDIVSLGIPSLPYWLAGNPHDFFMNIDSQVLDLYRYMHSLIVAVAAIGLIRLVWKPLFIPSLAWIVHLFTDVFMHGSGIFQTTLFYPLSSWGFDGIRWWEHPSLLLAYWLPLPLIWLGISMLRRRK